MGIAWIVPETIEHLLFSGVRSAWRTWMKVMVNIINTWCVLISEAAKFDEDDFNSFRGIACKGQTQTQTHRPWVLYLILFSKSTDFANKDQRFFEWASCFKLFWKCLCCTALKVVVNGLIALCTWDGIDQRYFQTALQGLSYILKDRKLLYIFDGIISSMQNWHKRCGTPTCRSTYCGGGGRGGGRGGGWG